MLMPVTALMVSICSKAPGTAAASMGWVIAL
jgi:hypothetical protein